MDKRFFNKSIKKEMLSFGFAKTGPMEYAKDAQDDVTKIVIRIPDMVMGFGVGAQFRDFGFYDGKINHVCMTYPKFGMTLCSAARNDYTEIEISDGVRSVMKGVELFLIEGKDAIRNSINDWSFAIGDERKQNEIYKYFGLPLIDPYSEDYVYKKIDEWFKQGGTEMMSLDEYFNHKEHYDRYAKHGCDIHIGSEFVTITYDLAQKS